MLFRANGRRNIVLGEHTEREWQVQYNAVMMKPFLFVDEADVRRQRDNLCELGLPYLIAILPRDDLIAICPCDDLLTGNPLCPRFENMGGDYLRYETATQDLKDSREGYEKIVRARQKQAKQTPLARQRKLPAPGPSEQICDRSSPCPPTEPAVAPLSLEVLQRMASTVSVG
jgi:hypothetical protein